MEQADHRPISTLSLNEYIYYGSQENDHACW